MMRYHPFMLVTILLISLLIVVNSNATALQGWKVYQASNYGHRFEISYQITHGTVSQIAPDIADDAVVVSIESNPFHSGILQIKIPRNLLWSDFMNGYNPRVQIDGKEMTTKSQVVDNGLCDRTVSVNFPAGSKSIDISWPYTDQPRKIGINGFIATDKACYSQGESIRFF